MKHLLNTITTNLQGKSKYAVVVLMALTLLSCQKEDLEIQQDFPFEVTMMPVTATIDNGQTVEIRLQIQSESNFNNNTYYLRYFQFEGTGILRYHEDAPYRPNDLYTLSHTQFRLYYTATSTDNQSFTIWISDSFGNEQELTFEFRSTSRRQNAN